MRVRNTIPLVKVRPRYNLGRVTFRDAINNRLRELRVTRYDLTNYSGIRMNPSTVYRYLTGTKNISSKNLEKLLAAVGLELRPIVVPPGWVDLPEDRGEA